MGEVAERLGLGLHPGSDYGCRPSLDQVEESGRASLVPHRGQVDDNGPALVTLWEPLTNVPSVLIGDKKCLVKFPI